MRRGALVSVGVSLGIAAVALSVAACGGVETPTAAPDERRIPVDLRNFDFRPSTIEVSAGEVVGFALKSADIRHTFTVAGAGIDTEVRAGRPVVERATFDQPGEFTLICTVPGHADAGMVGTIIVR